MKKLYKIFILLFITVNIFAVTITPSDIFTEVKKIEKEIKIIHNALYKDQDMKLVRIKKVKAGIKARHIWQKTYLLLVKINVLRNKYNIPRIEEIGMEPILNMKSTFVYGQTQRILAELRIFKKLMDIEKEITPTIKYALVKVTSDRSYKNKLPTNVYNELQIVSKQLDELIERNINPSDIYAQVMRIFDDISLILINQNIEDTTVPQIKKTKKQNKFMITIAYKLLTKIQDIEELLGIKTIDFSNFLRDKRNPEINMNIIGLCIAELQTIKAKLNMKRSVTPPALTYKNKKKPDVEQMLLWNIDRIMLLKNIKRY